MDGGRLPCHEEAGRGDGLLDLLPIHHHHGWDGSCCQMRGRMGTGSAEHGKACRAPSSFQKPTAVCDQGGMSVREGSVLMLPFPACGGDVPGELPRLGWWAASLRPSPCFPASALLCGDR